jgi:hypothetical protein
MVPKTDRGRGRGSVLGEKNAFLSIRIYPAHILKKPYLCPIYGLITLITHVMWGHT